MENLKRVANVHFSNQEWSAVETKNDIFWWLFNFKKERTFFELKGKRNTLAEIWDLVFSHQSRSLSNENFDKLYWKGNNEYFPSNILTQGTWSLQELNKIFRFVFTYFTRLNFSPRESISSVSVTDCICQGFNGVISDLWAHPAKPADTYIIAIIALNK